tara:strand:- start:134 stop:565 length:432 start_codon:yes stop_codon:yes gene_type:complete
VAPAKVVNVNRSPAAVELVISLVAPLLKPPGTPGTAQLVITPTAPTKVVGFNRVPAAAELVITPVAPAVSEGFGRVPAAIDLALTLFAPQDLLDFPTPVPQGNLTISTTAPSRVATTNDAPAETPWRDEDPLTGDWTEEDEAA